LAQSESDDAFVVLFVCTGNICRSPLAEQLFRAQTRTRKGLIAASSAGTYAQPGQAMTDQAAALSRSYGGDPSQHQASELTTERISAANLIVTMTRAHRAEVVSLVPRASRKTFTLREFDRLIRTYRELEPLAWAAPRGASAAALNSFVQDLASKRGFATSAATPNADDVIDPYRRAQEVYDEAGLLISRSVEVMAGALVHVTAPSTTWIDRDEASHSDNILLDQSRSARRRRGNDD
jgi:protein-tyrosine phosphatase